MIVESMPDRYPLAGSDPPNRCITDPVSDPSHMRLSCDGYGFVSHSKLGDMVYLIYAPKSIVEAMLRHKFRTYWNQTETYEALNVYIQMNMDGLKDAVVEMLAGDLSMKICCSV